MQNNHSQTQAHTHTHPIHTHTYQAMITMLMSNYKKWKSIIEFKEKKQQQQFSIHIFIRMLFHFNLDSDLNNEQIFSFPAPPYPLTKKLIYLQSIILFKKNQLH